MSARLECAIVELVAALREELHAQRNEAQSRPERLLDIESAARELGIGRTLAYDLIARGQLRSLKIGRRRLVPTSAISDYATRH